MLRAKMLSAAFLFTSAVVPFSASSHPLKMSASLIEYNPQKAKLRVECKVFIDDFHMSMSQAVLNGAKVSTLDKEDKQRGVDAYFKAFYSINFNGKELPLKIKILKTIPSLNMMVIQFAEIPVSIKHGDKLRIRNRLFFQDFGSEQSNRIIVRIPPFGINDLRVAKMDSDTFHYTFLTQ